ncbi:interference hedgehog-like isoform X2 [Onthophagus taurus]|uniref:interference hedgehog-like isoform X2 n=1 Tax=Onthophagus taurus TaxID=166361 RepID=UPI0039BE82E9
MKLFGDGLLEIILLTIVFTKVRSQVVTIQSPASVVLPDLDETVLECRMNIAPDRFQWLHYPVTESLTYTSKYNLPLSEARHIEIPPQNYRTDNASTYYKVENTNNSVAGDYQCLAHYGAVVFASKPGRISISTLKPIPFMESLKISVVAGSTVVWRCPEPESNPVATMEYYKGRYNEVMIYPKYPSASSLIFENVNENNTGVYTCKAYNTITRVASNIYLNLTVVSKATIYRTKPEFIVEPKKKYIVLQGTSAYLECGAIGYPIPTVKWSKLHSELPSNIEINKSGILIKNMMQYHEGIYVCVHENSEGKLEFQIEVEYHEPPTVRGLFKKEVRSNKIEEGQDLDIECDVTGVPKPSISWFMNGNNIKNDPNLSVHGNTIRFRPLHKRHAGMIQCFASNIVSTNYETTTIEVFPKQIYGSQNQEYSSTPSNHKRGGKGKHIKRKNKPNMMIPPSKPTVTRLNDESVVVRWISNQDSGLEVKFFKVQYRDVSQPGAVWVTTNADIDPYIRSFDVMGLQPDHNYRFRVAAVYSNDDNKLSDKSETFHLRRLDFFDRNYLPIPTITRTETINSTSIQVFWDYTPNPNISINGFYVNYISASSAGDYNKATVDGDSARTCIISHLEPGTIYEFKMQTFTSKSASDFSQRMRGKTTPIVVETTTILPVKKRESDDGSNLYIILAVSIVALICLFTVIALLIVCCKWKKKKDQNPDGSVKQPTDDLNHHIETHKTSRTNGFVTSGNHITIRSNPLAETDNKKTLARIFSRLRT